LPIHMPDFKDLQKDFPILKRQVHGHRLVYLDNASTTQKPRQVIDAISRYYETMNANIHRGIHELSEEASYAYEETRRTVAEFIHARDDREIIFTRNATEAINLVAYTWGEKHLCEGDNIVVSALEHHSNLVPWQQLCRRKGAHLKIIPVRFDGMLEMEKLDELIDSRTKLVAVTQMSNVLGTIVPLEKIIEAAHDAGAVVMVDGAQGVAHLGIDVQELDVDFLAFSGHKMCGPTGVGLLYGKYELLEKMDPMMFGGDMVLEVSAQQASWNRIPWKFEAGTPNIADVVALKEAIDYVGAIGFKNILAHDQKLLKYARLKLSELPGIKLYGPQDTYKAGGVLSFNVPTVHPHDVGSILNEEGVAIRAGHHCAQPLMKDLGVAATARISFYVYNDEADIDAAVKGLGKVYDTFGIRPA